MTNKKPYKDDEDSFELIAELDSHCNELLDVLISVTSLWFGYAKYNYDNLTPDSLELLYNEVTYFFHAWKVFGRLCANAEASCSHLVDVYEFEEKIAKYIFEIDILRVIAKSYEFSSKKSVGMIGIIDLNNLAAEHGESYMNVLTPVVVRPWVVPTMPEIVIPDKPRAVLVVSKVHDSAPRINVALDDVFMNQDVATEILVDEDVNVGDKVVILSNGWDAKNNTLECAQYDGLADIECPCMDHIQLTTLKYDFDLEKETAKLQDAWKLTWLQENFHLMSAKDIQREGTELHAAFDELNRKPFDRIYHTNARPRYYSERYDDDYLSYEDPYGNPYAYDSFRESYSK